MAGIGKEEKEKEWEMINGLWRMIKEFYIPEDTQEYHEAFCKCAQEIDKQCHSRLGQKLILAFADYLDERERNMDG